MQYSYISWVPSLLIGLTLVTLGFALGAVLQRTKLRRRVLAAADGSVLHVISYDSLTPLPNRLGVAAGAEPLIAAAQQAGVHVAVMVLNVDRLKPINDSLGHQAGDRSGEIDRRTQVAQQDGRAHLNR
jgi:predicted signal transduction protein with EAL and GGDEF domain